MEKDPQENKSNNDSTTQKGEPVEDTSTNNNIVKAQNPKGEKTIVCWNCLTVLMVKEEWNVVECTNCGKYNRVPGEDRKPNSVELCDNLNHFDLNIPYVFGIITCPFCQKENRFRRDAEHVVCYKCNHSFNVRGAYTSGGDPPNPYNNSNQRASNPVTISSAPQNSLRYSDLFYPDIMRYRGYYPQPYVFQTCDCSGTEMVLRKLLKVLKKKKPALPPPIDRYAPLRQFVRDIDDIDDRRRMYRVNNKWEYLDGGNYYNNNLTKVNGDLYPIKGVSYNAIENYKNKIYDDVYGYNNNNMNSYQGGSRITRSYSDYNTMKNDAINKMMFSQDYSNKRMNSNRYGDYFYGA